MKGIVMIRNFLQDSAGATAIEYGLVAMLVAIAAIAGMQLTGTSVVGLYDNNAEEIGRAMKQ